MHEGRSVLSIGTSAGADYYVEAQAEYYLGGTEPTGVWWNTPGYFGYRDGADVDPSAFKALHTGFNPRDGRALVQNAGAEKRRGGYDLTFSADKSISALWAVAPVAMRSAIEAAQEAAVRAALALVQERAVETRRGKDGVMRERVPAFGALFQHGDARSGDPDLHTHAVVLNVAERRDGTWGSLANEQLFRWKMAAGAVYRAELAAQLQERLGVAIDRHGERNEFIRVSGVPEALCEAWSKRRKDIEAAAAEKGFATGADAARAAGLTLATRGKKGHGEDRSVRWVEEAAAMGWTAAAAMALQGTAQGDPVAARTAAWTGVAQRVREIIEHESVFTEPKLWQVTAEAAAGAFPARDIAGLVRRLEAEGVVVRLPGQTDAGQTVYSTRQAIEDEVAVRAMARQAAAAPALMVPSIVAKAAINTSDPPLTDEQGAASYHAMTSGGGVALVEGAPGVGKSTLLRPVVQGYRWAGAQAILATAVAWRQARDLCDGVGADAALAAEALLHRWRAGDLVIGTGTVIVVDELGQWSARQTRQLLEMQRATGCRVIGVGDRRQLQPVGAGPGMRLLALETPVAIVDTIIRQTDAVARAAVRAIMDGDAATAIRAHRERGCLLEGADHGAAVALAAARWRAVREAGRSTVVVAETWADVRALSAAVRGELKAMGWLGEDALTVKATGTTPGRALTLAVAVGEELRFRQRDDRLGVVNGDCGRVLAIDGGALVVALAGGRRITVDPAVYRDKAGHIPITYAYASTLAAAQGMTVAAPILLGSDRLTRQAATVALSRGTGWTTVVLDRGAIEDAVRARRPDDAVRTPVTTDEVDAHLARAWSRDGEKVSALDHLDPGQVEAWVAGWRGRLPAEALSPTGQPVAEVVNLTRIRAERWHEAAGCRLRAAGTQLEGQGQRLAGEARERARDMAVRLASVADRLEAQGSRLAAQRAEADAMAVLDRLAAAGAVFRIDAEQRRTIEPLVDTDAGIMSRGWTERAAARFDAIAQAQEQAAAAWRSALETRQALRGELATVQAAGQWERAAEIVYALLPEAEQRLEALDPAAWVAVKRAEADAQEAASKAAERLSTPPPAPTPPRPRPVAQRTGPTPAEQAAAQRQALYAAVEARIAPLFAWRRLAADPKANLGSPQARALKAAADAAVPEDAAALVSAIQATGTPDPWRDTIAHALVMPNRVDAAALLRQLARQIEQMGTTAVGYRRGRQPYADACVAAKREIGHAEGRVAAALWRASRDPNADRPFIDRLIAATERQTPQERAELGRLFLWKPQELGLASGLRGRLLSAERREAKTAVEQLWTAIEGLVAARAAAATARQRADAYEARPDVLVGRQAAETVDALNRALNAGPLGSGYVLTQSAEALELVASWADVQNAGVTPQRKAAIIRQQQEYAREAEPEGPSFSQ